MELPQTLESLHDHLGFLVELLQQEQEALLHPSHEAEATLRLHRLDQEKQKHFQTIEKLEGECAGFREALSASPELAGAQGLWQQVLELTDQAARLHQLNSTLIRHALVHHQCVLNNLRRLGSPGSLAESSSALPGRSLAPEPASIEKPARKPRSRKKAPEHVGQEH